MNVALGLLIALASTAALSWGFLAQHGAATELPELSVRRPLVSLRLLFSNRGWLAGFLTGIGGWVLYVVALALAPLSLVQATSAGGIGLLALLVQRRSGRRLPGREWFGVAIAVAGLALLGLSLAGGATRGGRPSWVDAAAWTAVSGLAAALAAGPLAPGLAAGAGLGVAAGVLYAAGDVGTKAAVLGGAWLLFVPALLACHGLAFVALQLGFQRGGALATAGVASLLTNSLPIAGGLVLFHEQLPGGGLGFARVLAFACVVVGAAALARTGASPAGAHERPCRLDESAVRLTD
jgi:hypothetical protein